MFQVRIQQGDGIPRSRVIDQHVQPVAVILHGLDGGSDRGRRCHVELQEGDIGEGGQWGGDLSGGAGGGEDMVASFGEGEGESCADAVGRAAGYEDGLGCGHCSRILDDLVAMVYLSVCLSEIEIEIDIYDGKMFVYVIA